VDHALKLAKAALSRRSHSRCRRIQRIEFDPSLCFATPDGATTISLV
jgi:hypothetical protein